jgi:hypothetical protein
MALGAALALFFLWVASLIAMAVYSAKRPPERMLRPLPSSSAADPEAYDSR